MKKKVITMALALTLALSMTGTAFAAGDLTSTNKTKDVTVDYEVEESYTVTLPADVTVTTEGVSGTVSASDVRIADGNTLKVTVDSENYDSTNSSYVLSNSGSYVKYTINDGSNNLGKGGEVLAVTSGTTKGSKELTFSTTEDNIKAATKSGQHTDTLKFTVYVTASSSGVEQDGDGDND
jgi:hypothetical protein